MRWSRVLAPALAVGVLTSASATPLACRLGARCLQSGGAVFTAAQAVETRAYCRDFTLRSLGGIAMRLSYKEMVERTQGRDTDLARAWIAYGELLDSPLNFPRFKEAERVSYGRVRMACEQLERDYVNPARWGD
jgi:hypothetical protein